MVTNNLQKVMLAALENLRVSMGEGCDLSFLENIIDPEELAHVDLSEIEARIEGTKPERLVITLEGGLIESVRANKAPLIKTEVYINNLDVADAEDEAVEILRLKDGSEVETSLSKESILVFAPYDIDENVDRLMTMD